ncbi:MAG: beta-galactosidase [Acutalibacter sp.]|jgi:hypothetical protein|uniref:beta-galactosidase n=1 Tax=Acutalibacter sp. TaxID=1918636 RepID=UPI00216C21E8|nr:beta-galactosidase [Acutalibacter sp.]MCI9224828.1 beta-galactosidase [Acutalibacter sp.]
MDYKLSLRDAAAVEARPLGEAFHSRSKDGTELSVNSYYMEKDGQPFFGVSGEFHFSRMEPWRWEDELIKMKLGGVNIVATYVFWNHHEEEEGCFDFTGRRDLGRFVKLCQKHGLYVILRCGPFDHGEARNGGLPDWLYGKPFEVRKLNEGFLSYTRRLYTEIAGQVKGMFFKDGGPVIGVQIDNEYMASSAPWEMTTGISNEWAFGGDEGEEYLLRLKGLAAECGLTPVFYTCTGWGNAPTPDSMLPLWGGYAYRPWLFYSHKGEHPATEQYIYQDYHKNGIACTDDFRPHYAPEDRPYACCEMGGGMMCSYNYRFQLPYKSVDAMAAVKLASGCNFLGYYMYQGGSNPIGKNGQYLNESQVCKISYDYQAALGEFGQVRESYRRTKLLHYFVRAFAGILCPMKTVLPEGASLIIPNDVDTLRYAVQTDGHGGFLFVNNFQDHVTAKDRLKETVTLDTKEGAITFRFGIVAEENAILPFNMDLGGIKLVQANAQPVTVLEKGGRDVYVFFIPRGMRGSFTFEEKAKIDISKSSTYVCPENFTAEEFTVSKGERSAGILVLSRELAEQMYIAGGNRLVFTDEALLEDENGLRLETVKAENHICCYPANALSGNAQGGSGGVLGEYLYRAGQWAGAGKKLSVEQVAPGRYTLDILDGLLESVKDVRLQIDYSGDIGSLFLNGRLISDNFANGAVWEVGLREFAGEHSQLVLYITPLKEGANVNVESGMAARVEEVGGAVAVLHSAELCPVYEIEL